jgi:hypothetical protein
MYGMCWGDALWMAWPGLDDCGGWIIFQLDALSSDLSRLYVDRDKHMDHGLLR